ncbi:MAG: hypothetical protein IJE66_04380 [Akkermansia sp.]|nr:hypothetical protein [Akkermansia sp.]
MNTKGYLSIGRAVLLLFALYGVSCLPPLSAQEEQVTESAALNDKEAFVLAKALYTTTLDSFTASAGAAPVDAAAPIVSKMAELGITMEIKMVGGTKAKPVVLTSDVSLGTCKCIEALDRLGIAAGCEFQVLNKAVRFLYNGDRTVRTVYKFEQKFIFTELKNHTRKGSNLEIDGSILGLPFPEGCSMKYSIPSGNLTVEHHPQQHPHIRKILKEKYWAWQDTQSGDKKKNMSDDERAMNKLSVAFMPPIMESTECSVREAVELLNAVIAASGIKLVLHKDIDSNKRVQLDQSAIKNGGYANSALLSICDSLGTNYKVKKNKITIRLFADGERTRRYRISAQKFSELMGRDVSSEEELIKALHDLGIGTPAGTSVKWGEKKKLLILKSDRVSILKNMDDVMREQGIPFNEKKKKK